MGVDNVYYSCAGFNVETVTYKKVNFTTWDVGGRDKIVRKLESHNFANMTLYTPTVVLLLCPFFHLECSVHCGDTIFRIQMH